MDELKALSVFAKAVELGSFRAAANASDLSPSVVSYHIAKLEERYGIPLLYRSTRKLSLTADGEALYQYASQINEASRACQDVLAKNAVTPAGRLSLSLPAVMLQSPLTERIARFSECYPKLDLQLDFTDERQDLIKEGIDLCIRVGEMPDSSLKSRRIDAIHRKLVCSPAYAKSRRAPQHPDDMVDWEWINLSMLPPSRVFKHPSGQVVRSQNLSRLSVNSVLASYELAKLGRGLASPPDYMVDEDIKNGHLLHVLPEWNMEPISVHAVWPENVARLNLTRLFINAITED